MFKRIRDWFTRPSWDEYLADHQAFIDMTVRAENAESECSALTTKLFFAEQENERLRGLMIKQVEDSPLHSFDIKDGSVEIAIQPPHWAAQCIAMSFYDTLADAPNWRSLELGPLNTNGVSLIVTVRRMSGDTPEETVGKLKDLLAEWMDFYTGERNGDEDMVARTLTLLNPEKKD